MLFAVLCWSEALVFSVHMIVRVKGNGTELSQRLKPVSFSPFATTRVARRQTNKKDKYLQ